MSLPFESVNVKHGTQILFCVAACAGTKWVASLRRQPKSLSIKLGETTKSSQPNQEWSVSAHARTALTHARTHAHTHALFTTSPLAHTHLLSQIVNKSITDPLQPLALFLRFPSLLALAITNLTHTCAFLFYMSHML